MNVLQQTNGYLATMLACFTIKIDPESNWPRTFSTMAKMFEPLKGLTPENTLGFPIGWKGNWVVFGLKYLSPVEHNRSSEGVFGARCWELNRRPERSQGRYSRSAGRNNADSAKSRIPAVFLPR